MDITPRQKEFLSKLIDLYKLAGNPIHYTTLAKELGISKWSAYDMMKLFEEKGLATSDYNVAGIGREGGRSSIVFFPTAKAEAVLHSLAGGVPKEKEWQHTKEAILENLSKLQGAEYEKLLNKILKSVPDPKNPFIYCTDMTTALLLVLKGFKDKLKSGISVKTILKEAPMMNGKLIRLAGLTMGLSLAGLTAKFHLARLLGRTKKYESYVQEMDSRKAKMLAEFMDEAARVLLD